MLSLILIFFSSLTSRDLVSPFDDHKERGEGADDHHHDNRDLIETRILPTGTTACPVNERPYYHRWPYDAPPFFLYFLISAGTHTARACATDECAHGVSGG